MKFVLFSDLHLDTPFVWARSDAARKRRQGLRDALARIAHLARSTHADALLCAGDLYEQDYFSPDTVEFVKKTFQDLAPMPVYIAPGNHDWYGKQSLYYRIDAENVHLFKNDRLEPVTLTDGLTLWGAAHLVPANTSGFLDHFSVDRKGVNVALFHGSERGFFKDQNEAKQPHAAFSESQIEAAGLRHVFVGHFHKPRDAERYTYPGCPDPLAFGDPPGDAVVVEVRQDGSLDRQRHSVASTQLHDLTVDITGMRSSQDLRDQLKAALSNVSGVARVTLTGEMAPEIDLHLDGMEDVSSSVDAYLRVGDITLGYDLESIGRENTVRGEFVAAVRAARLTPVEERRTIVTGLRALEGREDLEVP